jgi:hypothetical protein
MQGPLLPPPPLPPLSPLTLLPASLPSTAHPHPLPPQVAITTLQAVLSEEFKAGEIEIGVVRDEGDRPFRLLSHEEVDHFLAVISERD